VAALPLLHIQEITSSGSKIKLYEGQTYCGVISIENIGTIQVDSIEVALHEQTSKYPEPTISHFELGDEEEVFIWDKSVIAKYLPLPPGGRIQIPIKIFARLAKYEPCKQ
jgi:hypothetical protein